MVHNTGVPSVDTEPHSSEPSRDWPWWWSTDQERFHGPCSSRADALLEAWAEEADVAFVCQATQANALCTDIFDGWRLAETFDDCNEESHDPDGDPLSASVSPTKWDALAKRLNVLVAGFVRDSGIKSWAFEDQTKTEEVNLTDGALSSLPPHTRWAIDELIRTLAAPGGYRTEYLGALLTHIGALGDGGEAVRREPISGSAAEDEELIDRLPDDCLARKGGER